MIYYYISVFGDICVGKNHNNGHRDTAKITQKFLKYEHNIPILIFINWFAVNEKSAKITINYNKIVPTNK